MNEVQLDTWLEGYRQAWETRDPGAAAVLFSEDVEYYETPFVEPARGRNGVYGYWKNAVENQSDVSFAHEIVSLSGSRAVVRWRASFKRASSGVTTRLDGVFLLEFDDQGRCRRLREWWHMTSS